MTLIKRNAVICIPYWVVCALLMTASYRYKLPLAAANAISAVIHIGLFLAILWANKDSFPSVKSRIGRSAIRGVVAVGLFAAYFCVFYVCATAFLGGLK